jgi:hypothetical protein
LFRQLRDADSWIHRRVTRPSIALLSIACFITTHSRASRLKLTNAATRLTLLGNEATSFIKAAIAISQSCGLSRTMFAGLKLRPCRAADLPPTILAMAASWRVLSLCQKHWPEPLRNAGLGHGLSAFVVASHLR